MNQKKSTEGPEAKRELIERMNGQISIRRQCELVGLNRSTLYYEPATESPLNLELMRLIDEQYMRTPFYGWPRMTHHLRQLGHSINHKRVQRLMGLMGLEAIYLKPYTSKSNKKHKVYPYLLRDVSVIRPGQVWCADITWGGENQG